jgi:polysaccharide biosynthesis protein PslG
MSKHRATTSIAALLALLFCATAIAAPPLPSRAKQQDDQGFYFQPAGLCDDYPEETTTSTKIQRDFEVLRQTGSKLLRFGIGWDGIEEEPGQYNWRFWDEIVETAERDGVTLLPYICYTPKWNSDQSDDFWRQPPRDLTKFGRFVGEIVQRYRGRIRSWELWNEPDNRDYWRGTPKQFATMFSSGAAAARRADPDALVVLGGLAHDADSRFTRALFERHGIGRLVDVINFHSYFETWDNRPAEHLLKRINGYKTLAARSRSKSSPPPDLWLAEFGYSSAARPDGKVSEWVKATQPFEHTRDFQAVALLRHHVLALATEQLAITAWFRIWDLPPAEDVIGDDNNRHFGVIDVQGNRKPAFHAMRLWNQLFDQPVRRIPIRIEGEAARQVQAFAFEKKDGSRVIAAWLRVTAKSAAAKLHLHLETPPDVQPTIFSRTGERIESAATFHDGAIRDVTLQPDGIFIAVLAGH